jgi:hypothetical protein
MELSLLLTLEAQVEGAYRPIRTSNRTAFRFHMLISNDTSDIRVLCIALLPPSAASAAAGMIYPTDISNNDEEGNEEADGEVVRIIP